MDINNSIGDKIEDFLWHYYNWDLMLFEINHSTYIRKLDWLKKEAYINRVGSEIDMVIEKKGKKASKNLELAMNVLMQKMDVLEEAYIVYKPLL